MAASVRLSRGIGGGGLTSMWRNAASLAAMSRAASVDAQQHGIRQLWHGDARAICSSSPRGAELDLVRVPLGSPSRLGFRSEGLVGIQHLRTVQVRQVMVDVRDNNVESALRKLKRKLREDNSMNLLRDHQYHVKPAEQRVLNRKARDLRLAKKEFRYKLRWIMDRRTRGF